MSVAVAIMTKTPGHSPVKTRLAETHGAPLAIEMHRRTARATASVVAAVTADGECHPYWAVAEPAPEAAAEWQDFDIIHQRGNGLGLRMAALHSDLLEHHTAAILMGADSPQLQADHLRDAIAWLSADTPRTVLGPASDGGFWLFGGNRPVPEAEWIIVPYSAPSTGQKFRRMIEPHGMLLELPTLTDIDRADDMQGLRSELRDIAVPTALQQELLVWLEGLSE